MGGGSAESRKRAIPSERFPISNGAEVATHTPQIYGHHTHPSHEGLSTRVLRGQAKNDTPPIARTEVVGTGDREDSDNRIDVILSGNEDMPPKCTSVLRNSILLPLLCQGRDNFKSAVRECNQKAYIAGSPRQRR